jgi:hypothetical protein
VFETGAAVVCIGLFGWVGPRRGMLVGEFRGCPGCGYDLAGITAETSPSAAVRSAIRRAPHPDNEPASAARVAEL